MDSSYDSFFKSQCESAWTGSGSNDSRGVKEVPDWAQPWYLSSCINSGDWPTLDSITSLATIQLGTSTVKLGWLISRAGGLVNYRWLELAGVGLGDTTTLPPNTWKSQWAHYANGVAIIDSNGNVTGHTPAGWYLKLWDLSINGYVMTYEQPGKAGWTYPGWSNEYYTYANSSATFKGIHR